MFTFTLRTSSTIFTFSSTSTGSVSANSFSMNEGDYLTLDVTTIGTTAKGKDMTTQFKSKRV